MNVVERFVRKYHWTMERLFREAFGVRWEERGTREANDAYRALRQYEESQGRVIERRVERFCQLQMAQEELF